MYAVHCTGVWGKITPMKLSVFIKLYPTPKIYTDISAISVTFRNSVSGTLFNAHILSSIWSLVVLDWTLIRNVECERSPC